MYARSPLIYALLQIDNRLAKALAEILSLPEPEAVTVNPGHKSAYLSQLTEKNSYTASGRKVGIFVLDGFSAAVTAKLQAEVLALGSIPMLVGPRKGMVKSAAGIPMPTSFTFEGCRSTYFDALFFPSGGNSESEQAAYSAKLAKSGRLIHAAREAYSHFKTIGACGLAVDWLRNVALPGEIGGTFEGVVAENGIVLCAQDLESVASTFTNTFLNEVAKHRAWNRDVSRVAA